MYIVYIVLHIVKKRPKPIFHLISESKDIFPDFYNENTMLSRPSVEMLVLMMQNKNYHNPTLMAYISTHIMAFSIFVKS